MPRYVQVLNKLQQSLHDKRLISNSHLKMHKYIVAVCWLITNVDKGSFRIRLASATVLDLTDCLFPYI